MKKRIVICCDGTWNHPEDKTPTNVVKIARSILPEGTNRATRKSIPQIVFYDWGIGTGNLGEKLAGGAFGKGLDKNIQDAYRFIVHNYVKGDELFLFGFSRGAYTVRSLGGLIRNCGIITSNKADLIPRCYTIYRSSAGPDCNTARNFRNDNAHHKDSAGEKPEIAFMGVWDTVGALGIPLRLLDVMRNERTSSLFCGVTCQNQVSGSSRFGSLVSIPMLGVATTSRDLPTERCAGWLRKPMSWDSALTSSIYPTLSQTRLGNYTNQKRDYTILRARRDARSPHIM
jgi:hypothetical protein